MATDDLEQLEGWVAPLLDKLQPGQRRKVTRDIALALRRSQHARIREQRNPDGTAFLPRKRSSRLRAKAGRIKRGAMFRQLAKSQYLKAKGYQDKAVVGFFGRVARLARVHQEGLVDRVSPDGPSVRYPRRVLLGFTDEDRRRIADQLIAHLVE